MHSMHHLRHADSRKIRLEKRFHEDASIGHMEHEFAVDHMVVVPLTRLNDHGDSWYHNSYKIVVCMLDDNMHQVQTYCQWLHCSS
jgi:hypothetical protein